MGLTYGGFDAIVSVGVAAFGGAASPTSGTLHSTTGQTAQSQSSGAKSQSSFSLLGNYTPSEYLNIGLSSFMQGFTMGTEYAGAFGAAQNELAAYAKSSTAAKITL